MFPGDSVYEPPGHSEKTMGVSMAETKRAIVLIVLLTACSQEFISASNQFGDSSSGNSIHIPDIRTDSMVSPDSVRVRPKDANSALEASGQADSLPVSSSPDSAVDASEGANREAGLSPEGGDSAPTYCVNCQPQFGRPACCSIYLKCGYITSLGNCTSGAF